MSLDRFERALLKSAEGDRPTPERRDAARSAVLQAAGVSTAVAVVALATTSTAAGATSGASAGAATVKTLGIVKLVLLAALSAGVVTALVVATRTTQTTQTTPIARSAARAEPSPSPPPPVSTATAQPTSVAVSDLPSVVPEPSTPTTATSTRATTTGLTSPSPSASPAAPDPLAVEARLLEAARACLSANDRACAHARLAEHDAHFARGALSDEASILAIDLAIADGNRDQARRIARSLLARRPGGAWTSRVKKLAEEAPDAQEEAP